ncbi:MAG: hypothetical protein ACRERD_07060, partial [Candidatus Binatia bacterium]
MARAAGDEEVGQRAAEYRPFLLDKGEEDDDDPPASPSSTPQGVSPSRRARTAPPLGFCRLSIFIIFVVVTVLGLSGLVLNFTPKTNSSPSHSHPTQPADQTQHVDPEEGHHDDPGEGKPHAGSEAPSIVHYHEDIPQQARMRDSSEYILSPSWDRNAPPTTREY